MTSALRRRWATAVLGGGLLVLCRPNNTSIASDVCVEPSIGDYYDWSDYDEIVVYIHPNMAENLEHSSQVNCGQTYGVKWTNTELRRAIESALLAFQESLAVGIPRIRVASGYSDVAWDGLMDPGTIHISARLADGCGAGAAESGTWAGGGRITFRRSGPGYVYGLDQGFFDCNLFWDHYRSSEDPCQPELGLWAFRAALYHELMHQFGILHPSQDGGQECDTILPCPAPAVDCSCGAESSGTVAGAWNCFKHDQTRLQDAGHVNWWMANPTERHRESFDAASWWDLGGPPTHAPWPGLSSNSASYMFMARRRPDYVNTYPQLYRWVYTTQAWEYWGAVQTTGITSLGPIDVAYAGSPAYPHIGHAGVASANDGLREIYFTKMTAPNTRYQYTLGNNLTPIDGVGIAYHDGDSSSADRFIIVWRDDELGINLTTATTGGVFGATYELIDDTTGERQMAAEAPSIDCSVYSALNTHPCVLVWAAPMGEAADAYQKLKWVHIGIGFGGAFTTGPIMEQGFVLYGPPQVTHNASGPSNSRFLLSWRDGGQTVFYTIGKPTTKTAYWDWTTMRQHSTGSGSFSLSPAVGAAGGAYEALEQNR